LKEKSAIVFQFMIVGALIGFNAWSFYASGILDETITGALIGLAVGIGLSISE